VPKSSGNVPVSTEIEDDGTLPHLTSCPAVVEAVKRYQLKYFPAFRIGKLGAKFVLIGMNWVISWNVYQENRCQVLHFKLLLFTYTVLRTKRIMH